MTQRNDAPAGATPYDDGLPHNCVDAEASYCYEYRFMEVGDCLCSCHQGVNYDEP